MEVHISPNWLREAWFKNTVFKVKPQLWVSGNQIKVTVFRKNGIGMRSTLTHVVDTNKECCIEIPDTLRAYVNHLDSEDEIILKLSNNNVMSVLIETSTYGVRYQIPDIVQIEDKFIETSPKDCRIDLCTKSWIGICRSMPSKGNITIVCNANKKMVTLKHSKGRWGAAITAKNKAVRDATFECDSGVTKFCFAPVSNQPSFSVLNFMDCGVLQWKSGNTFVHLAPCID